MDQLQWGHQPGHLHRLEQMGITGWTPALGALGGQEGLHQEDPARRHTARYFGHPSSIKITEEENRIKDAKIRPRLLQVELQPGDELSRSLRLAARFGQPGAVAVHRHHRGAQGGGSPAVAAATAGQIEDAAARTNHVRMRTEPVAGALVVSGA